MDAVVESAPSSLGTDSTVGKAVSSVGSDVSSPPPSKLLNSLGSSAPSNSS